MTARHLVRILTLSLACVASAHGMAAAQSIRGAATFRERMTLPRDAVFEATLEDASRSDAPAVVLGRTRVERPGNPPIRFQIPFDPSRVEARRWYVVRARIRVGERQLFATQESYPVLTWGNGRQVSLLLHRSNARVPSEREGDAISGGSREGEPRSGSRERESPEPSTFGSAVPAAGSAIFTGDLPCADCSTVRHQLELFGDESYFLRRTYIGRGRSTVVDDIGRWRLSRDRALLTLTGGDGPPLTIAIGRQNTLHVLAEAGQPITSRFNALTLSTRAQPLEPRLRMRGMYRYMADAGRFTECLTHQSWPVAQERENAALESAYSRARRQRGEELLVELEGRVAMRPNAEGVGRQRTLVVERFGRVSRGERCESRTAMEPPESFGEPARGSAGQLENTHWKLTRIGDKAVAAAKGAREAHLILHSATRRVSGSAGCNRLLGRYEVEDRNLTFSDIASSRMACPSGMDVERRMLAALRASATARVTRNYLELFDEGGRFLARFESGRTN